MCLLLINVFLPICIVCFCTHSLIFDKGVCGGEGGRVGGGHTFTVRVCFKKKKKITLTVLCSQSMCNA